MKKTLIFICLLAAQLQAQIHELDTIAGVQAALSGPHPNLFEAQRIIEDWKAARPNALIGKTQKHWNRFYNFWKHRVTATGDPAPYIEAFRAPNPSLQACTGTAQNLDNISPELPDMQNWGASHGTGILISLAAAPNSVGVIDGQILYAGTQAGGLFKSLDGGANWVNVTDNIGIPVLGVTDIDIHPDDPNHLIITCSSFEGSYFHFNYGNGVFQSFDAGQTWTAMNHPIITTPGPVYANHRNKSLLINPHNHNEYFLSNMNQIYRSCDKGNTWHLLYEDAQNREMRDMVILGSDPNTLFFLGTGNGGRLMNLNIPSTCQTLVTNINLYPQTLNRGHLRADKFENRYINLFYSSGNDRNIDRLEWDGNNFVSVETGSAGQDVTNVNPRNTMFEQSPTNKFVFYVGWQTPRQVNITNSHGALLNSFNINGHSDYNYGIALTGSSSGRDLVICATDGGIHVAELQPNNNSVNFAQYPFTWQYQALNRGLNNQQIYGIATKQTNPKLLLMNTQDEFAQVREESDGLWHGIGINEGRAIMIDYADPSIRYLTGVTGQNVGAIFRNNSNIWTADAGYWGIVTQHSNLHKNHYLINSQTNNGFVFPTLLKSIDSGVSWSTFTQGTTYIPHNFKYPVDMFSHPTQGNFLYISGYFREDNGFHSAVMFSPDAGTTLLDITPQPTTTVTRLDGSTWDFNFLNNNVGNYWARLGASSIACDPNDPYRFFVTFNLSGNATVRNPNDPQNNLPLILMGEINSNTLPTLPIPFNDRGTLVLNAVTWTDLSDGLPFPWSPANKVMYEEGTTDRIYLATDHGVFTRHFDTNAQKWTNWEQFMCSSSPVIDLEINYCTRKIIMATYGRGIWEADLPESHSIRRPLNPFASGTMLNWMSPTNDASDFYVQVHGDVVIHDGETLNINAKVRMDPHKRIIVEAGGKLNIQAGSSIGCDCPEGMMYGIVAEGPNGTRPAAEVIINNATIHDARLAVTNIYTKLLMNR